MEGEVRYGRKVKVVYTNETVEEFKDVARFKFENNLLKIIPKYSSGHTIYITAFGIRKFWVE